jgi:8-oxo-(d)GTP phosphatase
MARPNDTVASNTVLAAGTVLWRPNAASDGAEIAVIHRPKYDDWTLPKGKADPDEPAPATAARETREETGLTCVLGVPLPMQHYEAFGRPKVVRYWSAQAISGLFRPNDEVDEMRWLSAVEALELLTHERDGDTVRAWDLTPRDTAPIILLRHAKATKRTAWQESDALRPLEERGFGQAQIVASLLEHYGLQRIVSSDATRCMQTVEPLSERLGMDVDQDHDISEEGFDAHPKRALRVAETWRERDVAVVLCTHRPLVEDMVEQLTNGDPSVTHALEPGECVVVHRRGGKVVATEGFRS